MNHVRTSTRTTLDEVGATGGTTHEAYSFACMKCGHGWEQEYEISHLKYTDGRPFVVYYTNGKRVPSPVTRPTCHFCDGHLVRVLKSGRVAASEAARSRR